VAEADAGQSLGVAWQRAAEVAVAAAQETASLTPRIGRARPLAERSVGSPDPGAVSLGMIVTAVGVVLGKSAGDNSAR
jgi:dihydroxyacetone kinase